MKVLKINMTLHELISEESLITTLINTMKQNVHRIGSYAFEFNAKTVIVIEDDDFDVQIMFLEQLIIGEYNIICIDIEEDEDTCEIEYFVRTNIPWNIYMSTPDPNLKYFRHEKLN